VVPAANEAFVGVTTIETSTGAVTVRVVDPVIPVRVALIREVPVVTLVAIPDAEMDATLAWLEFHPTEGVRFLRAPIFEVPVAVNCCGAPRSLSMDLLALR